jgi:hypothetical protein
MKETDAQGLPSSVFQCTYQTSTISATTTNGGTTGKISDQKTPVSYANSTDSLGLGSCSYSATCSTGGVSGVCVSISAGCCSGTVTSNLCPGSSDIKCCTNNKCSTPSGSGTCMQTSLCSSKGGKSLSGYCTGPTDLQCCVTGGGGGVSRSTMASRMQSWVDAKVPYSQTSYYQGYRQDCSGYVAMVSATPPLKILKKLPNHYNVMHSILILSSRRITFFYFHHLFNFLFKGLDRLSTWPFHLLLRRQLLLQDIEVFDPTR